VQLYLLKHLPRLRAQRRLLDEAEKPPARDQQSTPLALKFSDNVLAETNSSFIVIDGRDDLASCPRIVAERPKRPGHDAEGKWVFTLEDQLDPLPAYIRRGSSARSPACLLLHARRRTATG
jgi:hypothetical protein